MSERMVLEIPEQVAQQARATAGNRRVEEVLVDWLRRVAAKVGVCPSCSSGNGAAPTTVPVTITPEAMAHLQQMGLEPIYRQITDHIQKTAPNLLSIETNWDYDRDAPVPERLVICPVHPAPAHVDLGWENEFDRWVIATFPHALRCHFVILPRFEAPHGR